MEVISKLIEQRCAIDIPNDLFDEAKRIVTTYGGIILRCKSRGRVVIDPASVDQREDLIEVLTKHVGPIATVALCTDYMTPDELAMDDGETARSMPVFVKPNGHVCLWNGFLLMPAALTFESFLIECATDERHIDEYTLLGAALSVAELDGIGIDRSN